MMPGEQTPKPSNRWEGTHTYKKPEANKKRARTVAQLREEAAANSRAKREEAINRRRGSIGGPPTPVTTPRSLLERRGSTGGLPHTNVLPGANTSGGAESISATGPAVLEVEILSDEEEEHSDGMPGSSKKKRHASARPMEEEASGEGVDKDLKAFLIAMKDDINKSTNAAVDRIDKRIDDNARQIGEIKQDLERRDTETSAKISSEVRQEVAKLGNLLNTKSPRNESMSGSNNRRDRAYNHCRRSLKMWPVRGENLEDEVRNFMATRLKFSQGKIDSLGSIDVAAAPGRLARDKGEILATFETKEDRDTVKAGGANLAGEKEVGMAIHVPGHLMDNLIALNGIGYSIKMKNKGVKRSVKFDDVKRDIYMDIGINGQWRRITPKEAREVMEKVPAAAGASSGLSLTMEDLSNLVQGEAVAGLTAVVVADDREEEENDD